MRTVFCLLSCALLLVSAAARADIYVGLGAYGTSVDENVGGTKIDDSDIAPAFFVGWRPIELVGVELGYYDFGKFQNQNASLEGSAVTLAGLLSMELGPVGVYAKGGVANFDFKASNIGSSTKDESTDPFGGIGVTADIFDKLYVYGEYLHFASDTSIDVLGAGVRYSF
jgi:hypothetical protein